MSAVVSNTSPSSRIRRILQRTVLALLALTVVPVLCLRWVPPLTSAFMVEKRIGRLFQGKRQRMIQYRWVGWDSISPDMRLAVVAAEDQDFPHHRGFDFGSILDALQRRGRRRRLRGASTISQQVARNLFLWPGRSFIRKGVEAYFTVLVEVLWPKRRILEVYLNIAEFGDGTFGVAAAAQEYFGRSPAALGTQESALLAAVLPNPIRFDARRPSAYVQGRARWIEEQMAQLGGPAYLRGL